MTQQNNTKSDNSFVGIFVVFNDGYAIRKLIENLSETAQETIFYFSRKSIQCMCEVMHGDQLQTRLLLLTEELPKDCYIYNASEDEVAIGLNLIELHGMITNVKVKIGRIRLIIRSPTDIHVQTVNSLSDTDANWEDRVLTPKNVERKYRTVDDYTTPPLAITKTIDFVRFCKEVKDQQIGSLNFDIKKNIDGRIEGIFMSMISKDGKYIKGKLIGSSESKDFGVCSEIKESDTTIKASSKLIDRWSKLTGFNDSVIYWNLDEQKPLKMVMTIDRYAWFIQWLA